MRESIIRECLMKCFIFLVIGLLIVGYFILPVYSRYIDNQDEKNAKSDCIRSKGIWTTVGYLEEGHQKVYGCQK